MTRTINLNKIISQLIYFLLKYRNFFVGILSSPNSPYAPSVIISNTPAIVTTPSFWQEHVAILVNLHLDLSESLLFDL